MEFKDYIFTCILILYSLVTVAQMDKSKLPLVTFSGYIKEVQSSYFIQKIDSNASANLIHNRLNLKLNSGLKWSGRLEIRNRVFYGEQIKLTPNFGKTINQYEGILKLSHLWIDEKSYVAHSVIDRFLMRYSDDKWDVTIGRQRINWGINNIWNPNDIFNAYNFLDFDYEERPGSDAIRIQNSFKNTSSLEIAYKPSEKNDENILAFLYKSNKWKYDFQLLSGIYKTDYMIGGGWAGNIRDASFKGEMSYFIPRNSTLNSSDSFSISLMVDQTFKNDWYVGVSGLYNSNPSNLFLFNGALSGTTFSAKMLFPFRYNFHTALVKTITPITSINFSTLYSPENNTLILLPTYSWNVATNFDLDATAQSFFAEQKDLYCNLITQFYVRGRWSF